MATFRSGRFDRIVACNQGRAASFCGAYDRHRRVRTMAAGMGLVLSGGPGRGRLVRRLHTPGSDRRRRYRKPLRSNDFRHVRWSNSWHGCCLRDSMDLAGAQPQRSRATAMKSPYRWFRFSLRTALVGFTVLAISLGWLAREVRRVHERRRLFSDVQDALWEVGTVHAYGVSKHGFTGLSSWRKWLRDVPRPAIVMPWPASDPRYEEVRRLFPESRLYSHQPAAREPAVQIEYADADEPSDDSPASDADCS